MTLVCVDLSDSARLQTLRQLDRFRDWSALDDQRFCLVCGKLITGREILIVSDASTAGPLQLVCPTEYCNSIPMDWVIPTREILEALATREKRLSSK